jgi:hypothetical protein
MKFDWLKICCEGGLIDFILFLAPCTVSLLRFMVLHYAIGEDMFLSKKNNNNNNNNNNKMFR